MKLAPPLWLSSAHSHSSEFCKAYKTHLSPPPHPCTPSHSHCLQQSRTDRWSVPRSCGLQRTLTLIGVKEKSKDEEPELGERVQTHRPNRRCKPTLQTPLSISKCIISAKPLAICLFLSVGCICQSIRLSLSGSTLISLHTCLWEWTCCLHSKTDGAIVNLYLVSPADSKVFNKHHKQHHVVE